LGRSPDTGRREYSLSLCGRAARVRASADGVLVSLLDNGDAVGDGRRAP